MRSEEEMQYAIETYADMVKRICILHVKQECDVDDVFQEVFFKYAKKTDFQNQEHEKAWLIRVTLNSCKDTLTTWFRRKVGLYDKIEIISDTIQTFSKEDSILYDVLNLPHNYRNVIYLYYYEGYKTKEIAQLLKCNENTVHTWLKRAKATLKVNLRGDSE